MASHGIRDQVAIVGMGCTNFGEHWDKSVDDLLIDSSSAALQSAGVALNDVDAFWLGTMGSGMSGLTLSRPLKIDYKPVSRLENFCATGSEAFRNACYAVASGAFDMAMAIGVEKLKDSGFSGLTGNAPPNDGTLPTMTAPASFSLLAPAYAKKYGVDEAEMKDVLTRIAWKNHKNGALNPRAQFRKEVPKETIACSPLIAGPLGIFDCSGVSDGSAAAIIVRAEDAHRYTDNPLYVKALAFVAGPAAGPIDPSYDYTTFIEVVRSAADAYAQAGIDNPRAELAMAEVHDCFTPTELVLMEDLGFAERGMAWKEVLAGTFDLTHNLGGAPGSCVSFVSIVGSQLD
jgi:acetyl-CoA C-acetyltransferase